MSLTITIELSERDLDHFRQTMQAAHARAGARSNADVIAAARDLLDKARRTETPEFVTRRLELLDVLIAMLGDDAWGLPDEEAEQVRSTLLYFVAPDNVIADEQAVLGFLDDAIMIELCARELHHEIDAYIEFSDFRRIGAERRGVAVEEVGRADWLQERRDELHARMRRRREQSPGYYVAPSYRGGSYSASRGLPGLFRAR